MGRLQVPFAAASLAFRPPSRRGIDAAARLPTGCQRCHLGAHRGVDAWRTPVKPPSAARPYAHASGTVAAATTGRDDGVPDPARAETGDLLPSGAEARSSVRTDDVASTSSSAETRERDVKAADPEDLGARPGVVMWFRQDLRLHDNQAFRAAVREAKRRGGDLLCVYVWSEEEEGDDEASWRPGGASRAWLKNALDALDRDLRHRYGGGIAGLTYMRGAHADALRAAMHATDASVVFASERFEPAHVANDARVAATLARENLSVTFMPGHLLFDPRETKIDMANEKYYFGTLMPYVHAAEKYGGKPGAPRPAPPSAPLAGASDAAAAARAAARLRAECEKTALGASAGRVFAAPDADALGVLPASDAAVDWSRGIRAAWDISEAGAEEAWSHFKRANLARYEDEASLTDDDATAISRLSPYLRFGQISPRRMYHELSVAEKIPSGARSRNKRGGKKANARDGGVVSSGVPGRQLSRTFWHRLYRREFAYWQLTHWPRLATRSVRAHYEDRTDWRLAWTASDDARVAANDESRWGGDGSSIVDRAAATKTDASAIDGVSSTPPIDPSDVPASVAFARWRAGQTGFPAVDVGMRRLWRTGWMHQTERMIAATFLTDYLGVDWRHGARWFHDTLVDADLAINAMMWQNAGKSGLDQWDVFSGALAPDGSSRGHDPRGDAIARWIPELAGLPAGHWRHRPWEAPERVLREGGVELAEWDPEADLSRPPARGREDEAGRAREGRAAVRATYPSRVAPDPERLRARSEAGIAAVRAAQIERAVERMERDGGEGVSAPRDAPRREKKNDVTDVLVDPRTGTDYVLVPVGATRAHAGALLPVSTRKAFKKALKAHPGVSGFETETPSSDDARPSSASPPRLPPGAHSRSTGAFFALSDIGDWCARRLNVGTTAAAIDRRTGGAAPSDDETGLARACDVGKKRSERAERDGTSHSHSHAHGGVTHSHSHGGHSHAPGDAIGANHIGHTHGGGRSPVPSRKKKAGAADGGRAKGAATRRGKGLKSSSWAVGRGSGAVRGAAAKEAERRAVKAGRREARELAAWSSGMRVGDVWGEEEEDGY